MGVQGVYHIQLFGFCMGVVGGVLNVRFSFLLKYRTFRANNARYCNPTRIRGIIESTFGKSIKKDFPARKSFSRAANQLLLLYRIQV